MMFKNLIDQNRDINFMSLAIRIAKKNLGLTSPNPSVGCVIVKNNVIISTGTTAFGGRPHAEFIAVEKAKNQTSGATLYVSLEPCCHKNKTNPCAELIIKSGITRVVIATIDPDSKTSNLGIKKLREAGITVEVGLLEEKAKEIINGFFTAKTLNRPSVTLKLATSLDGKIALKNFESKWITNQKSRQYSHLLRAQNDAILIGGNSVRKDNPTLNCRIDGLENFSPKRIIISNKLDIDLNSKIIQSAKKIRTYIATTNENNKKFLDHGIEMIYCLEQNGEMNFEDLLEKISALGINNLLVEGGSKITTKLLERNLVDKLIWIRSGMIIGNDGIAAIGDLNFSSLDEIKNKNFIRTEMIEFDEDIITIYHQNNFPKITKIAH